MLKPRFFRVWIFWAVFYSALAAIGPNGLVPTPVWPVISQHIIQARAWLGDDIEILNDEGFVDRELEIRPRLSVTPYYQYRVVNDSRESTLIANLAVAVTGQSDELIPLQQAWTGSHDIIFSEGMVCHVGFPPGPSFLLFPLLALLGGALATQWLGALLGGLAVATMDRLLAGWTQVMGPGLWNVPDNLMAGLVGAGTLWLWIVPDGGTFLFAQVVGTTALTLALLAAWRNQPWLAGLAYGIAISSRPAMLFALPLVIACGLFIRRDSDSTANPPGFSWPPPDRWIRNIPLLIGPLFFGGLTLLLNFLRFGTPGNFGYLFMIVPPELRERLLEHGQLSVAYLAQNLNAVILQPPTIISDQTGNIVFPFFASDPEGMGILFVTPAFAALALAFRAAGRHRQALLSITWISLVLTCLPGLLYYNTGWVQWGGRFLVDAWPMWLLLAATGLQRMPRWLAWALIALSIASNAWGALLVAIRSWPGCCF